MHCRKASKYALVQTHTRCALNPVFVTANTLLVKVNALLQAEKASPPCLRTWVEESVEHLS
jgi:hypothetical protein